MRTFHRLKKEIGNAVLEKFNYTCTKCGQSENLCIHHKIKMHVSDERYNDIENLTVLCRSCHMSHHRSERDIVPPNLPPPGNPYGRRGKKPPIKCSIFGCDRWQHGKGLCKKHYEFKRKRGLL